MSIRGFFGGRHARRFWVFTATLLLVAGFFPAGLLNSLPAVGANLDPATYTIGSRSVEPKSCYMEGTDLASYTIHISDRNKEKKHTGGAPFTVSENGVPGKIIEVAYCVSEATNIVPNKLNSYTAVNAATFFQSAEDNQLGHSSITENEAQIRWIVNHGFKGTEGGLYHDTKASGKITDAQVNQDDFSGYSGYDDIDFYNLTAREAIKATQAAIWYYSDKHLGIELDETFYANDNNFDLGSLNKASDKRMFAFYKALVACAASKGGEEDVRPVEIKVEIDGSAALQYAENGGKVYGPYHVAVTPTNGTKINNGIIQLASNAAEVVFASDSRGVNTITEIIVDGVQNSGDFYVVLPSDFHADQETAVEITATVDVNVNLGHKEPLIFVATDSGGRRSWNASQAIIASVPAAVNVTSYAVDTVEVPQEVLEKKPDEITVEKFIVQDQKRVKELRVNSGDTVTFEIEIKNKGQSREIELFDDFTGEDDGYAIHWEDAYGISSKSSRNAELTEIIQNGVPATLMINGGETITIICTCTVYYDSPEREEGLYNAAEDTKIYTNKVIVEGEESSAIIEVKPKQPGEAFLAKEVWDEAAEEWKKSLVVGAEETSARFRITIQNSGEVSLDIELQDMFDGKEINYDDLDGVDGANITVEPGETVTIYYQAAFSANESDSYNVYKNIASIGGNDVSAVIIQEPRPGDGEIGSGGEPGGGEPDNGESGGNDPSPDLGSDNGDITELPDDSYIDYPEEDEPLPLGTWPQDDDNELVPGEFPPLADMPLTKSPKTGRPMKNGVPGVAIWMAGVGFVTVRLILKRRQRAE